MSVRFQLKIYLGITLCQIWIWENLVSVRFQLKIYLEINLYQNLICENLVSVRFQLQIYIGINLYREKWSVLGPLIFMKLKYIIA